MPENSKSIAVYVEADPVLKLKRQIRDYYNKNANDITTLLKVSEVLGCAFKILKEDK